MLFKESIPKFLLKLAQKFRRKLAKKLSIEVKSVKNHFCHVLTNVDLNWAF